MTLVIFGVASVASMFTTSVSFCQTQRDRTDPLYKPAEAFCQVFVTETDCDAQAQSDSRCRWEIPVSTWDDLSRQITGLRHGTKAVFALSPGFTSLADSFKSIVVNGAGTEVTILGDGNTVIDAHAKDRVFVVQPNATLTVEGVVMQNGKAIHYFPVDPGGGEGGIVLLFISSTGTFKNCTFANSFAISGGAVSTFDRSSAIFENSLFINNSVSGDSSGVQVTGKGIFKNCTFKNNQQPPGGTGGSAVSVDGNAGASVVIDGCMFINNTSGGECGAVFIGSPLPSVVRNCMFLYNTAYFGGAIFQLPTGQLTTIENCTFVGNQATQGGAILNMGSNLEIIGSRFLAGVDTHQGNNDIYQEKDNQVKYSQIVFACPTGTTGHPVITDTNMTVAQLPPQQEIAHCTPKPTPAPPSPTKKYVCHRPGTAPGQCVVVTTGGVSLKDCTEVCN
jgi:hypothetical protein